MKIYLAAPLFTQVERRWNRELARLLEKRIDGLEVVLPQDYRVEGRFNDRQRLAELFKCCIEDVRAADVVVAILDGSDADSGVAFEMGYAYARATPIVGVRTDFRQSQERGVNMMVSRPCAEFVCRMSFNESIEDLADVVAKKIVLAGREGAHSDGPASRGGK
jgi:nucleoside 2-deoxyribosyltransferase